MSDISGEIVSIHIAAERLLPLEPVDSAMVLDHGLAGDRYEAGAGAWSKVREHIPRHITLIGEEDIAAASAQAGVTFTPEHARRNVVTRGLNTAAMVGRYFRIGDNIFLGAEPCDPCARPGKRYGAPDGFQEAFEGRGGVRAAVVFAGGEIAIGDPIELLGWAHQPDFSPAVVQ